MTEEMSVNIVKCYDEYMKDRIEDKESLMVEDIEAQDMTPVDFSNPHRQCWRISVPYRVKAVFEDENFYPNQWKFHQFYPARSNKRLKSNADTVPAEKLLMGEN